MARKKQMTFEQALQRLEELVAALENGEATLEQSIQMYKEGMELSAFCSQALRSAEKEIMILQENVSGDFIEKPFLKGE